MEWARLRYTEGNARSEPAMSEPWYKDGLRFTCTMCGDCCTGEPGYVWVDDDDLAAIADFLGENVEQVEGLNTHKTRSGLTLRVKAISNYVTYELGHSYTFTPT